MQNVHLYELRPSRYR